MLLRALRWGLAGALVAWTLLRLLGLERGWPLVPLFAFTPCVAADAVGAVAAALSGGGCRAAVAAACALRCCSRCWCRGRSRPRAGRRPGRAAARARGQRRGQRRAGPVMVALARWLRSRRPRRRGAAARAGARLPTPGARAAVPDRSLQPLPGFDGTGLYSRLPLRAVPASAGTRFGLAAAAARPPGAAPVEMLAIHVPAPTWRATAQWRHDMRTLPTARLGRAAGAGRRLQRDARPRRAAARARPRLPGRRRAGRRRAAPDVAGRPVPLPAPVTIDHVLADRRVRVVSARPVAIPGSDHRGVLAELRAAAGASVAAVLRIARREPSAILLAMQLVGGAALPVHGGQRRRPRAVQRLRHRGPRARRARRAQLAGADLGRAAARRARRPCCC